MVNLKHSENETGHIISMVPIDEIYSMERPRW